MSSETPSRALPAAQAILAILIPKEPAAQPKRAATHFPIAKTRSELSLQEQIHRVCPPYPVQLTGERCRLHRLPR